MQRKAAEDRQHSWRGECRANGFYKIDYEPPMSVREILEFGPSSITARIFLFALVTGVCAVLFSFYAEPVLKFVKKLDWLFLFFGLAVLAGAFILGKKFGRPFAIMLKWVGMPLLFLGVFGVVFARLGFAAFWVGPVDLYWGKIAQQLIADGIGNGAFRGLLAGLGHLKEALLHEGAEGSILTLLVRLYRSLGATMNFYAVIPLLVLISLGIFMGTVLLLCLSAWLTIGLPVAACALASRGLCWLDERF